MSEFSLARNYVNAIVQNFGDQSDPDISELKVFTEGFMAGTQYYIFFNPKLVKSILLSNPHPKRLLLLHRLIEAEIINIKEKETK